MRRRLLAVLTVLAGSAALPPAAGAAPLRTYAHGVRALADGGHRVALADARFKDRPTRVIDERTGEEIATIPGPGCDARALGAGTLALLCSEGPTLVSVADGSARAVPVSPLDRGYIDPQAVGSHWLWLRTQPYHVDGDYLIDVTGKTRPIRKSSMSDPYHVYLPQDEVIDLDAASGTRRLCAPVRRHSYRRTELFFRADDRGAVWSAGDVRLQRCGHRPVRLSRRHGSRFVATRRTVAWIEGQTAIAVDRRTLSRRRWQLPGDGYDADLALSHRRLWVDTKDRRDHPVVLMGRLPR